MRLFLGALLIGIGKKQLFAIDLVLSDGGLPLGTDQPIDKSLPVFGFDMRMFGRIDQHHAILV